MCVCEGGNLIEFQDIYSAYRACNDFPFLRSRAPYYRFVRLSVIADTIVSVSAPSPITKQNPEHATDRDPVYAHFVYTVPVTNPRDDGYCE